jgi:hypothetical protein
VRQQQRQQFGFVAVFLAVTGLQLGACKKQLVTTGKLSVYDRSSSGLVSASALGSFVTHFGKEALKWPEATDFCTEAGELRARKPSAALLVLSASARRQQQQLQPTEAQDAAAAAAAL